VRDELFFLGALFAAAIGADLEGAEEIVVVEEERVGTAGTLYDAAADLTERFADFLTAFLTAFLAGDFFTAFLTVFFAADFLATDFFAVFLTAFFAAFLAATNNSLLIIW
jgi:hypothetical protein